MTFCAEGAEKIFLRALLFLVQAGRQTHGMMDFGRRVEQRWAYYFLRRRPPDTREAGLRPARRAEVGLLFLRRRTRRRGDAERRGGGGTRLKSNNPNTEGGEKLENFARPFTPRTWLARPPNFGKTRFGRFPTFRLSTPKMLV